MPAKPENRAGTPLWPTAAVFYMVEKTPGRRPGTPTLLSTAVIQPRPSLIVGKKRLLARA
jgi:hypothetical protein